MSLGILEILVVMSYLFLVVFLGWLGFSRTRTTSDYLIAGRKIHPFVMALSYGATFISTSAIVGFGGVAGLFGMSVLWLTFLNIFVGIFIAFVFLAPVARKMGHKLDAHTFPELLGRRYDSKFIQIFAGIVIFLFIPLYAAAVLIGGCEFISTQMGIDYNTALFLFSIIIAAYVVMGGLKGVMYSDALQGSVMFIGMFILLIYTYTSLGGVSAGNSALTSLEPLVPGNLRDMGHRGWTAMPEFGFGDEKYNLWWIVISTITLGVGIGVLAQPQLIVRFMTVRSTRELNRAVLVGGIFILTMTGVAFVVGSVSNAYFSQFGRPFTGRVVNVVNEDEGFAVLQVMEQSGDSWDDVEDTQVPVRLSDERVGEAQIDGQTVDIVQGRSISIVYAGGNPDQIIPTYITQALPAWFGLLFMLTLLGAAMSTLSSQFHAVGTSIGRDVYEQITGKVGKGITITRIGILIGITVAMLWSYYARGEYIIARATAIFFGLCASAFLPAFVGGLFIKRISKAAALASIIAGFVVTAFWLVFIKAQEAQAIGLIQIVTGGKTSLLEGYPNWPVVDPVVVALPAAIIVLIIGCLLTKPLPKEHLDKCFS